MPTLAQLTHWCKGSSSHLRCGELLALVDCDWITTMRTGAVAAVSASKIYELVKDKDIPNIEIPNAKPLSLQQPDVHQEAQSGQSSPLAELRRLL